VVTGPYSYLGDHHWWRINNQINFGLCALGLTAAWCAFVYLTHGKLLWALAGSAVVLVLAFVAHKKFVGGG
jgi:hypothetical protein